MISEQTCSISPQGFSAEGVAFESCISYSYHLSFFYATFRFYRNCLWPRKKKERKIAASESLVMLSHK